tara:strand:- start:318 stop:530 length:213 start_codon:yes stop_codon:yes gene_type:complete
MADDFKNYIKNYDKSGKGAEKKKQRDDKRATLLWILLGGFLVSCLIPPLFILWVLYLIFILIYACREWMG